MKKLFSILSMKMLTNANFKFTFLDKEVTYVLGVSGGPDSMFLLDKMKKLNYKLVVAHVNYKKRENSEFDEKIVNDYCKKNSIDFFSIEAQYYNIPENKNFQSLAREIRYNFFSKLCREISLINNSRTAIVVAHNLEDLIETYFIQKERNSLVKFWGLPFISNWDNYQINRPILNFTKSSILNYLRMKNLNYVIDYTNEQNIYLRNFFRKKVFSFSFKEKKELLKNINKENRDLSSILKQFNLTYEKVVSNNELSFNSQWKNSDSETKKRIIYQWVNEFSDNNFLSRKKNTLSEILKQFESNSDSVIFNFKNGFKIKKYKSKAFVIKV